MISDVGTIEKYYLPLPTNSIGVSAYAREALASDLSPLQNWQTLVGKPWAKMLAPSVLLSPTLLKPTLTETVAPPSASPFVAASLDKWFADHLSRIADAERQGVWSETGDRIQVQTVALANAQYLIALFAGWPVTRRPDLAFDTEGRVNFSAKSPGYYLHLTYEDEGFLNWYAEVDGQEYSEDEAAFDGVRLPAQLQSIGIVQPGA